MASNPIPSDQSRWSVYGKLYVDNQRFLWGLLDELAKKRADRNAAQQKIGDYFGACMDEAAWTSSARPSQLRQYRRHHRPRAHPRLRRPRPAIRRQRQPSRLVDEGRRRRLQPTRAVHRRPVRAIHDRRRHQDQQQAHRGGDIADLGGLILARMAWKAETKDKALESRDGLTPEQRFFVGYAQWTCEDIRPEELRVRAVTDQHSPGKYRVNGLVANMPQFARALSCKPGSAMVREKACRRW